MIDLFVMAGGPEVEEDPLGMIDLVFETQGGRFVTRISRDEARRLTSDLLRVTLGASGEPARSVASPGQPGVDQPST